jgi:epoxyqueuosine reductase QueG
MLNSSDAYTQSIKDRCMDWGADLVGVADVDPLKGLRVSPAHLLDGFSRAVSLAIQLPFAVFDMISTQPTPIYSSVYKTANQLLDQLAFRCATMLQEDGYRSLPIPASQILDTKALYGAISHKAVARMAGLGWQGKNLLLITPRYGSRVRLVSVLTRAPLRVDGPVKNRCGRCTQCRDACPADAIKGVGTTDHYGSRNEAVDMAKCAGKLQNEFKDLPHIGAPICGICIKACPFGRKPRPAKTAPMGSES